MVQTIKIRVAEDGTLTIPPELVAELEVGPEGEVEIVVRDSSLLLQRPRSSQEKREQWERIEQLLKEGLANADWEEIHAGREDCPNRCF
ncbi:MAG: hypothetical protein ACUVV0_00505 [Anaerolineae bacterium]